VAERAGREGGLGGGLLIEGIPLRIEHEGGVSEGICWLGERWRCVRWGHWKQKGTVAVKKGCCTPKKAQRTDRTSVNRGTGGRGDARRKEDYDRSASESGSVQKGGAVPEPLRGGQYDADRRSGGGKGG